MGDDFTDRGVSKTPSTPSTTWRDQVVAHLGRLRLHRPLHAMTAEQERLFWTDYLSDLEGYDANVIGQACERYRRSENQFYPQTGQLRALCNEVIRERAAPNAASSAAYKLDQQLEREGWRPPTEAEKAQVTEIMDRLRARFPSQRGGNAPPERS